MMSELLGLLVSILNIAICPLFGPVYLLVLWIIFTNSEFKSNSAYTVILLAGVLDLIHMVTSFLAGLINFYPALFGGLLGEFKVGSCMRNGYLVAVPLLELILACNRLAVITRIHGSDLWKMALKVFIIMAALLPIPFLYLLTVIDENIVFSYHEKTYRYKGPAYFEKPFIFSRVLLVSTTLATYSITVFVIIAQRKLYGSKFKLSTKEFRLLLQALFQSLPLAFVILSGAFLFREIWKHGLFFVLWAITAISLPAIHLLILLGFNSMVRNQLLVFTGFKKHQPVFTAAVRKVSVATISVRSFA